jgi:hypothetical protein
MPRVGFEPMIPACEQTKTVHALDCAVIVIGDISRLTAAECQIYSLMDFTKNSDKPAYVDQNEKGGQ